MKKRLNYFLAFILIQFSVYTYGQKERLIGLWEIQKVEVGEQNMTPVAKWTKINTDGTYESGNGWLQNVQGQWNYDSKNRMYSASDSLGIVDEFGGFTVSFDRDKMLWEREEEGMLVKVILAPIKELPMAPADYLEGMWKLTDISDKGESILNTFDKEHKHKLFIRWDRIYINFSPEGKKLTGYWHIHGHKSEITLLPHAEGSKAESWVIEVNRKQLIMTGISDSNKTIQRKYMRSNTF